VGPGGIASLRRCGAQGQEIMDAPGTHTIRSHADEAGRCEWGVASRGTIRSGERADSRGTRTIRPHSGQAGQRERDVTSRGTIRSARTPEGLARSGHPQDRLGSANGT
jgi:hypothetical protein